MAATKKAAAAKVKSTGPAKAERQLSLLETAPAKAPARPVRVAAKPSGRAEAGKAPSRSRAPA